MLIDTHCHLDFSHFDADRDKVIQNALENDVQYLINIGSSLEGSKRSLSLAKHYDFIYTSIGIHPHEADRTVIDAQIALKKLAVQDKVVAIGETGLDYYKNFSSPEKQRSLFITQLQIAREFNLPVIVHSRDAKEDTLKILKEAMPVKAVIHCFSGNADFLERCLELGFLISFTCNITYLKSQGLREIVKLSPLDRMLLETDAPYLSPECLRGRRNEPANIALLAQEIAVIKGTAVDDIAKGTSENARSFFNLKLKE